MHYTPTVHTVTPIVKDTNRDCCVLYCQYLQYFIIGGWILNECHDTFNAKIENKHSTWWTKQHNHILTKTVKSWMFLGSAVFTAKSPCFATSAIFTAWWSFRKWRFQVAHASLSTSNYSILQGLTSRSALLQPTWGSTIWQAPPPTQRKKKEILIIKCISIYEISHLIKGFSASEQEIMLENFCSVKIFIVIFCSIKKENIH